MPGDKQGPLASSLLVGLSLHTALILFSVNLYVARHDVSRM